MIKSRATFLALNDGGILRYDIDMDAVSNIADRSLLSRSGRQVVDEMRPNAK